MMHATYPTASYDGTIEVTLGVKDIERTGFTASVSASGEGADKVQQIMIHLQVYYNFVETRVLTNSPLSFLGVEVHHGVAMLSALLCAYAAITRNFIRSRRTLGDDVLVSSI